MPLLLPLLALACQAPPTTEVLAVDLVDGGSFAERYAGDDPVRSALIPWWRRSPPSDDPPQLAEHEGAIWLQTEDGQSVSQPIAAYAPLVGPCESAERRPELLIRGRVRGSGRITVTDGTGAAATFPVTGDDERFAIDATQLAQAFGHVPQPRLELRLGGHGGTAQWTAIEVRVPLPAPLPEALRAEIVERFDEIVTLWLELGLDPETGLLAGYHDALTGQRLGTFDGGVHTLWIALLEAQRYEPRANWQAALERFLGFYLERGFDPTTGLPARWDFARGAPDLERHVEIHVDLRFLLDVAEHGPAAFRERALERALAMAETVLARGVLPDGQVAASYRPRDAEPTLVINPIRQLDVPALLTRVAILTDDLRYLDAARNALAAWEYTHRWPGTWDAIDNGFDDEFGMYAGDALAMLAQYPEEAAFRAPVRSGYEYYAPRWQDALRFGGSIATDQVRCWKLLLEFAELEPEIARGVQQLIPLAVRNHFKGEQYSNGAWGDVTFEDFDPRTGIAVGDRPGAPSTLLEGIALAYRPELESGFEQGLLEVRAIYTALLRSTVEHYRRPYGYLLLPERAGANFAGGGLRLLTGLAEMLARLDAQR